MLVWKLLCCICTTFADNSSCSFRTIRSVKVGRMVCACVLERKARVGLFFIDLLLRLRLVHRMSTGKTKQKNDTFRRASASVAFWDKIFREKSLLSYLNSTFVQNCLDGCCAATEIKLMKKRSPRASERTRANEGERDGSPYRDNELGSLPGWRSKQHWQNPFSILPGQRTSSPNQLWLNPNSVWGFGAPANLSQCLWPSVNFISEICAFALLPRETVQCPTVGNSWTDRWWATEGVVAARLSEAERRVVCCPDRPVNVCHQVAFCQN